MESTAQADEGHARLMMGLFMASWSIGFIALFAAYFYLRFDAVSWPPAGSPAPPRMLTGLATLVAIASSAAYHWALLGIERGKRAQLVLGLSIATFLALQFILIQLGVGARAYNGGLRWQTGVYAAYFWIISGFHLAHVVVGFGAGLRLTLRARRGDFGSDRHLPVRLWGYYWHSIGFIWVLIYLLIFLS